MKRLSLLLRTASLLLLPAFAGAQESMMQDVSPAYVDRLVQTSRANYAKYKWTTAKVAVASVAVTKAKLSWFDFLQVSYWYTPGNKNEVNNNNVYFANGYQLGFFLNVGNILQKPAVVRQARMEQSVARYDKEVVDVNIEAQVKQRYYAYLRQLNILKLRTNIQSDAADHMKSLKFKFEKGQVNFDTYSQAQISYAGIIQEKITAEADLLVAKSNLEELLGTSLENIR